MMTDPIYKGAAALEFSRRISPQEARDIAVFLDLHPNEVFTRGGPRELWDWLQARNRLGELPDALRELEHDDLARFLEQNKVTAAGSRVGADDPLRGGRPRRILIVLTGVAVALVAALVAVLLLVPGGNTPRSTAAGSGSSGASRSTGDPSPVLVQAKISKTMDIDTNTFAGVKGYSDPGADGGKSVDASFAEGQTVSVVCQVRHGRVISNPEPYPGRQLSSPVWDKVLDQKDVYVPDLYVDLPKVPGDATPDGLPLC